MSGQIKTTSLSAPGFYGLNTQESGVTLDSGYALVANNCVIDKYGRLGARKGWSMITTNNGTLADTDTVDAIHEVKEVDGNVSYLSAGGLKMYSGLLTLTEVGIYQADQNTASTRTFSDNRWQFATIAEGAGATAKTNVLCAQIGQPLMVYRKSTTGGTSGTYILQEVGTTGYGLLPTGYTAPGFDPDCVLSAYGRIWAARMTGDKHTVYYTQVLDGTDFSGAGAGLVDIAAVVGNNDEIVALAAHNGFLIIFCMNNIVVYASADDPTNLVLQDVIVGVGCIARDSVQNTGTDIVFLSKSGVRSLSRTIQEKSMPMRELSLNIRDDLTSYVEGEVPTAIRSVYYEKEAFYLLTLPTLHQIVYFDTKAALETGAARTTLWNNVVFKSFCATSDRRMLVGVEGGIGYYNGYSDNGASYRLQYYTNNFDLGLPTQLKFIKDIEITAIGGDGQDFAVKYAYDYLTVYNSRTARLSVGSKAWEYSESSNPIGADDGEFSDPDNPTTPTGDNNAEYSGGIVIDNVRVHASGSGSIMQVGIEADISGNALSIQKISLYLKTGRIF